MEGAVEGMSAESAVVSVLDERAACRSCSVMKLGMERSPRRVSERQFRKVFVSVGCVRTEEEGKGWEWRVYLDVAQAASFLLPCLVREQYFVRRVRRDKRRCSE